MKEIVLACARGRITALRGGDPGGPRVLALHGWLDNAASFLPLSKHLEHCDLVALDLPGHGGSEHRQPGYDYAFVDWIHDGFDALDALGWQKASLLGHSMGGAIACMMAASLPARIERLALIEALGPVSGKAEDAGARLRQAVVARRALDPARAPRTIADLDQAIAARLAVSNMSREAAKLIVERNLRVVSGGFAWRSDPRLTLPAHVRTDEAFILDWLRAIEAPTLVIAAEPAPPYFTAEQRSARAAQLRDGRVLALAGSHHLHMEQPDIVGPLIREFLAST
ncbi:alpha/beta fold hydrolase [Arenimonas sp.]|uniref:alpha/beta fold hydrolase n=1 Tax=Arenimonas sp. TaxID=1872635 RepID=UPI0039E70944